MTSYDTNKPGGGGLPFLFCDWLLVNVTFFDNNFVDFYCENLTPKDMRIFAPKNFSSWRKIPQILKSGINHMVTSNGGHPLHHHLWHSSRLSNSLFNRRTTKFQTFTQWPQASALQFTPQWPYRSFIFTPADRVQSNLTLYVLGLSITHINKKKQFCNLKQWTKFRMTTSNVT